MEPISLCALAFVIYSVLKYSYKYHKRKSQLESARMARDLIRLLMQDPKLAEKIKERLDDELAEYADDEFEEDEDAEEDEKDEELEQKTVR